MSSNKPNFLEILLNSNEHNDLCNLDTCITLSNSYQNIKDQCSPNADPLFQDFRYGIICDALEEFKKKKINKINLILWKVLFSAVFPWDVEYEILRQNVNRRFVVFPIVIAMCKTEKQVKKALITAIKNNIPLCCRGGAHCYEPYSICDGMVIDQSRRTNFKIDKNKRIVVVEPGCLIGPLSYELGKFGLALPSGTCANVGVAGLCLGGGFGFTTRKYGLTCDNLIELKMLDAKGNEVIINKNKNSDLFWAVKGAGGGNFGIITSFSFRVHPINNVIIFELFWPKEKLHEVLSKWLDWGPNSDNNLTTELDVYAINSVNKLPVLITGLYIGDSFEKLTEIINPLLLLNPHENKMWKTTYVDSVRHFTYQKFPAPFFKNKSKYIVKQLPIEASQVIIKYMSKAEANDRIEFDCMGGVYSNIKKNETAYVHRDALAWIQWITRWGSNIDNVTNNPWEDYIKGPRKISWLFQFYNEFKEVCGNSLKGSYVNCPESELINWPEEYYGSNLQKLIEIKKKWDPEKIFAFPQGLSQLF